MRRRYRVGALLALSLACMSVFWLAGIRPAAGVLESPHASLVRSGLSWVAGNGTAAFFVLNSTGPVSLHAALYSQPQPRRIRVWDGSDQAMFARFSGSLERTLSDVSFSSARISASAFDGPAFPEPAVLVVVGSAAPSALLQDGRLSDLLDQGWVVLYSGMPFSMMRTAKGIDLNPDWDEQSRRLGLGFDSSGPGWSDYALSARNGTVRTDGPWQIFQRGNGTLAVFPGLLDSAFADPDAAADFFAAFILRQGWARPVRTFGMNFSAAGVRTFFSPVLSQTVCCASVWTDLVAGTPPGPLHSGRQDVSLYGLGVRVVNAESVALNRTVSVSFLSNLSAPTSFDLVVEKDGQAVGREPLGLFPPGLSWHSHRLSESLAAGDYVLDAAGTDGSHAYSALRVFQYRLDARYVDPASKAVYVRITRENGLPASGAAVAFQNRTHYADGEGQVRIVDKGASPGLNHRHLIVDGVPDVPLDYALEAPFLSSWSDRFLVLAGAGLFGVAWVFQRRKRSRIRLLPSGPPASHRVPVDGRTAVCVFDSVNARFAWVRVPLHASEFSAGLCAWSDPSLVVPDEDVRHFLSAATQAGLLRQSGDLWMPQAWYLSASDADAAFFRREVADVLALSGWQFRPEEKGTRMRCRCGGAKMDLVLDCPARRIRRVGLESGWTLEQLQAHLDAPGQRPPKTDASEKKGTPNG